MKKHESGTVEISNETINCNGGSAQFNVSPHLLTIYP